VCIELTFVFVEILFQLKSQASVCRAVASSGCDLPEYCDGVNHYCPTDIHKRDGTNCTVNGVRLNLPVVLVSSIVHCTSRYAMAQRETLAKRTFLLTVFL